MSGISIGVGIFYTLLIQGEHEMIDYKPLWETMKEKNVSTYSLIRDYHFSKGTLDSLKQNRNVTLNTIETLCKILQVPVEKVVRIIYDDTDVVK